jgi:hypothetical protein
VTGDSNAIFLGATRLEEHLKRSGQHAPFAVARLLVGQDWQAFERRYAATGRAPYAPSLLWTAVCRAGVSEPAGTPSNKSYCGSSSEGNLRLLLIVGSCHFVLSNIL